MRNFKRFLTLVLATLMVVSTFVVSTSAAFTDVSADDKALTRAVNLLSYLNVTKGTTETTFSPDTLVTREQMAAFIYRLMRAGKSVEGGANTSPFTDLEDATFFYMVSWAANQKIINGVAPDRFNPKGNITLQDAYTMIVRALGYEKKEAMPWPFGYIDVAEDLDLDENLPSSLTYTDALTRGNVAILLYNTFFADMYDEDALKYVTDYVNDGAGGWEAIVKPVKETQTVAEKIFEVEKITQRAVATPHYYFNNYKMDASFDVDVIRFIDPETGADAGYYTFEELGLAGKADDYFLSDFTLYVKDETVDGEDVTKVLYAEPLLVKKTGVKATLDKFTSTKDIDNFFGDANTTEKANKLKPTGKITVDGSVAYMWDAPYSYVKPTISSRPSEAEYYEALNAKNVEFIGLTAKNGTEEEDIFHFVDSDTAAGSIDSLISKETVDYAGTDVERYTAETFLMAMSDMYWNGYYELDTYDCDGDGKIDYIWYKPFTFGQFIEDEDFVAADEHVGTDADNTVDVDGVPTIYTYEAVVEGEYKDEDFGFAYVNGPANYIKVLKIVEPTKASVVSRGSQWAGVTLSNGANLKFYDTSRTIYKFHTNEVSDEATAVDIIEARNHYGRDFETNTSLWNDAKTFYIDNGLLLYSGDITENSWDSSVAIAIPLADYENGSDPYTFPVNANIGGKLKTLPYINFFAYGFDGDEYEAVPVNVSAFTEVDNAGDDDGDDIWEIDRGVYDFSNYVGQLCSFKVDADGKYSFETLATDDNDDITVLATDDEDAAFVGTINGVELIKVSGSDAYKLVDFGTTDNALTYTDADSTDRTIRTLTVDSNTKIIIKDANDKYAQYGANKIYKLDDAEINNVQFVIVNNPNSTTREYLAAFYGEIATDAEETPEEIEVDNYAIIKDNNGISKADDGYYHVNYTLFNPITGETVTGISASYEKTAANLDVVAKGTLVALVNGKVQDGTNATKIDVLNNVTALNSYEENILDVETRLDEDYSQAGDQVDTDKELVTRSTTKVALLNVGTEGNLKSIEVAKLADLDSDSNNLRNFAEVTKAGTTTTQTKYADKIEIFYTVEQDSDSSTKEYVDFVLIVRREYTESDFTTLYPDA